MTDASKYIYPHGKRTLDSGFLKRTEVARYQRSYSLHSDRPWPIKHPLLQQLVGTYEIEKALPEWWEDCITRAHIPLRWFLPSITVEEYVTGIVDEKRWKLFRAFLSEEQKRQVPQSPKIGGMLQDNPYLPRFETRGTKSRVATIIITDKPEDIFYMSNGYGWDSCMHYQSGSYKDRLRSQMFAQDVGMAYILADGKTSINEENALIARSLLHVMSPIGNLLQSSIVKDKTYGNDASYQSMFAKNLKTIVENKGIEFFSTQERVGTSKNFIKHGTSRYGDWSNAYQDSLSELAGNDYIVDGLTMVSVVHYATAKGGL